MADEQENAVHLAITLAASHYAPQEWFELPSRHRTLAIYRELRELDAAEWQRHRDGSDGDPGVFDAPQSLSKI
ncbi:MAG: hypothetical protein WA864_27220 [Acetobacteraceae bacterium]|jgi:hypothetical protein